MSAKRCDACGRFVGVRVKLTEKGQQKVTELLAEEARKSK